MIWQKWAKLGAFASLAIVAGASVLAGFMALIHLVLFGFIAPDFALDAVVDTLAYHIEEFRDGPRAALAGMRTPFHMLTIGYAMLALAIHGILAVFTVASIYICKIYPAVFKFCIERHYIVYSFYFIIICYIFPYINIDYPDIFPIICAPFAALAFWMSATLFEFLHRRDSPAFGIRRSRLLMCSPLLVFVGTIPTVLGLTAVLFLIVAIVENAFGNPLDDWLFSISSGAFLTIALWLPLQIIFHRVPVRRCLVATAILFPLMSFLVTGVLVTSSYDNFFALDVNSFKVHLMLDLFEFAHPSLVLIPLALLYAFSGILVTITAYAVSNRPNWGRFV